MYTVSRACSRSTDRPSRWRNATHIIAVLGWIAAVAVDLAAQAPPPRNLRMVAGGTVSLNGLSVGGPASVAIGQTVQYTVQATDTNGSTISVNSGAVWSTSNSGLATISQSGVLTALATGTVTVRATYQGLTAQFATTLASTTASSPYGPQSTITCPAGAVSITPGQSIQGVVNFYPGTTTFCLRAGVHYVTSSITPKTGNTFVGEYGAILDGSNWSTTDTTQAAFRAHNENIDYVTIRNLVIRKMPQKGIHAYYWLTPDHWTIENNEITGAHTGLTFPDHSLIRNNYIHHNYGNPSGVTAAERGGGYGGYYASYTTFENNEISYNGKEQKVMESTNVTFRNNFVHHNQADGIWYDGGNPGALVEGNRVEDNARNGIFYEAGDGGIIRNNTIRRSGDTGVFISTSQNAEIYSNTVEDNFRAITYFVNCGGMVGRTIDLQNNSTHDNIIRVGTQSGAFATGMSYTSDCTPAQVTLYHSGAKNLKFTHNTYYVPNVGGWLWLWNGLKQWFPWQGLGQDTTGTVQ